MEFLAFRFTVKCWQCWLFAVVGFASYMATSGPEALLRLRALHPLFIEGPGNYDTRDPSAVARNIASLVRGHWERCSLDGREPVLVIQGDPLAERGISAITRAVAKALEVDRCLICLDETIDASHAQYADREGVMLELRYSQLSGILDSAAELQSLTAVIDDALREKNELRVNEAKPPLASYYRDYALLQEVSKAACRRLCGTITLVHTVAEINPSSVTSFYEVGVSQGLYSADELVRYEEP